MNLLSIQGYPAKGYCLDQEQVIVLHSLLHSLFDHQYLLINSSYKIDLLYNYKGDLNDHLIKKWTEIKGKSYTINFDSKFYSALGSKEALESYFIRLYQIIHRKDCYDEYISEFDRIAKQSPKNTIVQTIISCFEHINLSDFKTLYSTDVLQKKLTIDRHSTHALLIDYLERFIEN